jgi:DNA polymerase-3 subunit alpha
LKPANIVEHAKKREYPAVCLTDFTTVAGAIEFYKECKKKEIKPIFGCELLVTENPTIKPATLTLVCKNKTGWETLLKIVSQSNDLGGIPHITIEQLTSHNLDNFICIDGYEGSLFFYEIFSKPAEAYFVEDYDELAQNCLAREWHDIGISYVSRLRSVFEHYFIETTVEECCSETNPLPILTSRCAAELAKSAGVDVLIDNPVYYPDAVGAIDQRVLLCSLLKCTISNLNKKILCGSLIENRLNIFLKSTFFKFHDLPKSNHHVIYDLCEEYEITSDPKLPRFSCPNNQSEIEYLKTLCREGWLRKLKTSGVISTPDKTEEYKQRVLYELDVIERAGLAGYFLIVQDYVNEFRNRGCLVGPARGSAAGSLVAYLIGITLVDPIPYGLLFERFFNPGRITPGKISLPDIDVDFPPDVREDVIQYLREKYGADKVGQIATYGRLQGKSALKEVLRVNEYCSFDEMNTITAILPPEGAISDQLEEVEDHSIILWALENESKKLKDYCYMKDGELHGDYSRAFAQAIRLEGTFKSIGKHAAATIVSSEPLDKFCPMVRTARSADKIIAYDMYSSEDAGAVKMDILGVSALQKIAMTMGE